MANNEGLINSTTRLFTNSFIKYKNTANIQKKLYQAHITYAR